MGPKFDPTAISYGRTIIFLAANVFRIIFIPEYKLNFPLFFFCPVYLRAVGGEVGATSALAPKIGPLGLVSNILLQNHKTVGIF